MSLSKQHLNQMLLVAFNIFLHNSGWILGTVHGRIDRVHLHWLVSRRAHAHTHTHSSKQLYNMVVVSALERGFQRFNVSLLYQFQN